MLLGLAGTARAQSEEPAETPSPEENAVAPADLRPPACLLRGEHPRVELVVTADDAAAARLEFSTPEQSDAWYAVAATRNEQRWIAVLPQVVASERVFYRLVESNAAGDRLATLPVEGAYLADVVEQACSSGTADTVATPQITLTVPDGSPRVPVGFADANIVAFVAATGASTPASEPTPSAAPTESAPEAEPTAALASTVTERRFALSKGSRLRITGANGKRHEGWVTSVDDKGVRLDEKTTVRWSDVGRVEEYEGPGGKRILGALGGAAGGFALTLVYFVAAEDASETGLYVGIIGGAVLGALVVPGTWKTVDPVTRAAPTAKNEGPAKWLARHAFVVPQRGGATAGVGLRF